MTVNGYRLLDSGNFRKLEHLGPYCLVRPAQAAVWKPRLPDTMWAKADAIFERHAGGDGKWLYRNKKLPMQWQIAIGDLQVIAKLTDFGHIGMFPEHHGYIDLANTIHKFTQVHKRAFRLLNLFAYTGIPSLLALRHGAEVVHVDASKTSVAWAKENAEKSALINKPIRWIVDDAQKFVAREIKRGVKYDGILLDPPSYGRGTKNQIWKIETHLIDLLDQLKSLLSNEFSYIQLSAHTPGFTPLTLQNLLIDMLGNAGPELEISSYEMTIKEDHPKGRWLPSGACSVGKRIFKESLP